MTNDQWLRNNQAADYAGVDRTTWYRWGKENKRPPPDGKTPAGDYLWRASTIDRFFEGLLRTEG